MGLLKPKRGRQARARLRWATATEDIRLKRRLEMHGKRNNASSRRYFDATLQMDLAWLVRRHTSAPLSMSLSQDKIAAGKKEKIK